VGDPAWAVVLPVKRLAAAKARLRGAVPAPAHDRLVLAFAVDTVTAVLACPAIAEVIVVTDDPAVRERVAELGALVVPDDPDAGLNAAVAHGAALATGGGLGVAALTADLPALHPADLADALGAAGGRRSFVPDASGVGTVLLAAPPGVRLDPRFGPESAAAHAASGAARLPGDWPSLRRDVDTADDLAFAVALGVGRHTAALLAALSPG
jgi:2-phospho-L-lactate guanylyltransferase